MAKRCFGILFVVGLCLLSLNTYGLFCSLRAESLQVETPLNTFLNQKERLPGESDLAWATRLTQLVQRATVHAWGTDKDREYNVIIPAWENWLIYIIKYVYEPFRLYEFIDVSKGAERGVGYCSQRTIILTEILRGGGIPASIIALDGHVLAAMDETASHLLDPDYGVIIPVPLNVIQQHPEHLRQWYPLPQEQQDALIEIVSKPAIVCADGVQDYLPKRYYAEPALYVLKWIIPLLILLPYIRQRKSATQQEL